MLSVLLQWPPSSMSGAAKKIEMALQVPTKSLLQPSPYMAMLFAPIGSTQLPPIPPYLLKQNLSPNDIAIMRAESLMKLIGVMGTKWNWLALCRQFLCRNGFCILLEVNLRS